MQLLLTVILSAMFVLDTSMSNYNSTTLLKPTADLIKTAVKIQRSKTATIEEKEEAAIVILDILIYYGYSEE